MCQIPLVLVHFEIMATKNGYVGQIHSIFIGHNIFKNDGTFGSKFLLYVFDINLIN